MAAAGFSVSSASSASFRALNYGGPIAKGDYWSTILRKWS
jgi:hypothetical protein